MDILTVTNMPLLISAYIADLIFGDPERFPHPVRWIGRLINFLERMLKGDRGIWIEHMKGVMLVFIVVGASACSSYLFIFLLERLNHFLGNLASIYVGYVCLSIKDLRVKGMVIMEELKGDALFKARKELSKIVGRDTDNLSGEKVVAAAVESIAENTNDGIIAPLFYFILGGPVLAIAYKAVNTLDSMVGYKNKKYIHFGWASAKLDDTLNFIPARITGILIVLSAALLQCSLSTFYSSGRTMLRDGRRHPSPNSGISEAAMAGALGIRLGGPSTYQGKEIVKPFIGEEKRKIEPFFIKKALDISLLTSMLMILAGVILEWVI